VSCFFDSQCSGLCSRLDALRRAVQLDYIHYMYRTRLHANAAAMTCRHTNHYHHRQQPGPTLRAELQSLIGLWMRIYLHMTPCSAQQLGSCTPDTMNEWIFCLSTQMQYSKKVRSKTVSTGEKGSKSTYNYPKRQVNEETHCTKTKRQQEAQLSPRDRAMRRVSWNLTNCHTTVQKLLIRQLLNKPKLWIWRVTVGQYVINMCTEPWRDRVL